MPIATAKGLQSPRMNQAKETAMRVYEVMSKAVETVRPKVAASEAKTRMKQKNIHHLVVANGTKLEGVVSERDLGGAKLPKVLGKFTVSDLMSSPAITVTTRTTLRRAATLMKGQSLGSLVVTSANLLTISTADAVSASPSGRFLEKRRA